MIYPEELGEIKQKIAGLEKDCSNNVCLYPGCSMETIKAHSIQKKRVLELIAEDERLMTFDRSYSDVFGAISLKMNRRMRRVFSIFRGFCDRHDGEIFRMIDFGDFCINPTNT